MRDVIELLGRLRAKGVSLTLDGDSFKCAAPPGVLTAELRSELTQHKQEILSFLRGAQKKPAAGDDALNSVDRSGPLPLSYAQQRLWFLNQLDPESPVYNIPTAVQLTGRLDVGALERSIQEIIRRHESLRTGFTQTGGVPQAFVREDLPWSLQVIDCRHLAAEASQPDLVRFASALTHDPIDIGRPPLFRAQLLITGTESHILILTVHHIVFDGWSMGVFVRELGELYRAHLSGTLPSLPALAFHYVDFAVWQKKWLESGALERQLAYWKKQLAGAPPVVTFPADHPRPPMETFHGARSKLTLGPELTRALETTSQRHGVTLFMTLLAAFNVLLARYTGLEDVVVGSPSAGRTRSDLSEMMGFFVNNLVLRTDLSGNPSFSELLTRVREVTRGAYDFQDLPFDQLVQALKPERLPNYSPLFQTMFILQNFPIEEIDMPGVKISLVELEVSTARFDLTVEVFPRRGTLDVYFDYNTDLYDAETMERVQQHYLSLLEAVVQDAARRVGDIPLLSQAEREKLLFTWNRTAAEIPELCFHQRFEEIAAATPDRVALMAGDEVVTCGELNRRASHIAAALRAEGAGPEKLVAVFLERGTNLVAALLGVAKSGAAYVPLDPVYPKGRIHNILEDAQPVAVLTSAALVGLLPETSGTLLCVEDIPKTGAPPDQPTLSTTPRQENLAYVIFTSGSTGRPKGVQIGHRALLNFLEAMRREPGLTADDVLLAVTTVSFDIAGLELLLPLYVGATLCIALQPGDPASLLHDLKRYRPTVMQATPATWKLLLAAGWEGDSRLKILCGGEALETGLAQSLLPRCAALWNMYGPTETTIWSAAVPIGKAETESMPVGRPILNTTFYVLDAAGQPVPQGVMGELWIGGEGLARGYLNRPDLTAERFVPCPWAASGETRMYRTGDLVRYRPDGTLDFFGRADHQVKLRGFRIELGEIENALRTCAGVTDAVTLLRDDQSEKRLVAYLVHPGDAPSRTALRNHLRETLPEYMIPAAFVFLDALPRLPNGKLDRNTLLAPEFAPQARPDSAAAAAAGARPDLLAAEAEARSGEPSNHVEMVMTEIWRDVLGVQHVGVHDNFFELGGHSLSATQVVARLRTELGLDLPLRSIFLDPTIAELSRHIVYDPAARQYRSTSEAPQWNCLVPVQPVGTRTPFFFIAGYQSPDDTLQVLSRLIPFLGKDQPVFGFRPRWTDGGADYETVDEMAREFLKELRAVQPHGPYLLGGWCVGGIAAMELARVLMDEGEEVRLMLLVDTDRPSKIRTLAADLHFLRQRLEHIGEVLVSIVRADRQSKVRIVRELFHKKIGVIESQEAQEQDRFYKSKVRYRRLLYTHSPKRYPGRLTLIVNDEHPHFDRDLGWSGFGQGGLKIVTSPGNHTTMFTDHRKAVAHTILQCIDEALAADPPPGMATKTWSGQPSKTPGPQTVAD